MKIRATDGFWSRGRLVAVGDVVELPNQHALDAIDAGRAVALDAQALVAARTEATRAIVALLGRQSPIRW